jgi:aminopeptidase N
MKKAHGFQNKNIRQLWLVFAIATEGYKSTNQNKYIKELQSYTSPMYSFEIRELALSYINNLNIWNDLSVKSLVNACLHHNWRFKKKAKNIFTENIKNDSFKKQVLDLFEKLNKKEKELVNNLLIK